MKLERKKRYRQKKKLLKWIVFYKVVHNKNTIFFSLY